MAPESLLTRAVVRPTVAPQRVRRSWRASIWFDGDVGGCSMRRRRLSVDSSPRPAPRKRPVYVDAPFRQDAKPPTPGITTFHVAGKRSASPFADGAAPSALAGSAKVTSRA